MNEFTVTTIYASDHRGQAAVDRLLELAGINRDLNLDYTCGIYNQDHDLIATGSCFMNSLRCLAIDPAYQGEQLLNSLVSHLVAFQQNRGYTHIFLYTKTTAAKFFNRLGFHEIARVPDQVVFMENQPQGFARYLKNLKTGRSDRPNKTSLVMNANPFTLGHRYLVDKACQNADEVHLFIVSEDQSLFPHHIRRQLIMAGTQDLDQIVYQETGPYLISQASFPSYFFQDKGQVVSSQAQLDAAIFIKIAETIGITSRLVGQEPFSQVTAAYNQAMQTILPKAGISCYEVSRLIIDNQIVSASHVRDLIKNGKIDQALSYLPATSQEFLTSPAGQTVIAKIQASQNVIHH
ncbi:[citrate [pro-3S]-lyase] ligase [Aerococcus urinaehominis]|uniref:[Citrate [pro-3S]-lyase] ligase n=2 Tax=Aerococcus urinaehominis TaxID=128944 RepID=A0A0X8FK10_9LACT|nr:[citrate (pro-3S)-lyase] ligase [Aerococcus urinaehominis]AMB98715.1 [citrate [pro-3S]-lyase] ligase [Aerococcus urinaehominis]SDL99842.1 [citrate (pro-3S)-lyase] ligase [Aerococcus urinaehominis]